MTNNEIIRNMAKAIHFMGTNKELTLDEIIKLFSEREVDDKFVNEVERGADKYFVTTISKNGKVCVGYFDTYEKAEMIVKDNTMDIFESCYEHAVIEKIPTGLYQFDTSPKWFKWNFEEERYEECETPEFAKSIVGWAIN